MSKLEVAAKDGIVRIPKSVFESAPAEVSSSSDVVAKVRRLDGTVDELKRVTPDNPNFQPRKPTPGKVKAVNKDEALIAFYTRKVRAHRLLLLPREARTLLPQPQGMPLPDELKAKAEALREEEDAEARRVAERAKRFGITPAAKPAAAQKGKRGQPAQESAGASLTEEERAAREKRAKRFGASVGGSVGGGGGAAGACAPRKERPKGGVKVLSGVEGAMAAAAPVG